jgi:AcrR family transcriptional regulator
VSVMSGSRDRRRSGGSPVSRRGHGLGRDQRLSVREGAGGRVGAAQVSEVQRARMLIAAAEVVGESGYGGMSVARVTDRARMSRRTFYELFDDREDCFLAVCEEALARATALVQSAVAGEKEWRERVRTGLVALLVFVQDEPVLGSLLIVDALAAGPRVLERRARVLDTLAKIIDEGRTEIKKGHRRGATSSSPPSSSSSPPVLTAQGTVGAVLSVIHARLLAQSANAPANGSSSHAQNGSSGSGSLLGLVNPLMSMIVLPYLGQAAAAKELERPTPKPPRAAKNPPGGAQGKPTGDPLQGIQMRLTYRTLRVLSAIATDPGASNREIANNAGVTDQGQISKLLGRLERLGLIHNTGSGQPKGEPNAWGLTPKGIEVERALSPSPVSARA